MFSFLTRRKSVSIAPLEADRASDCARIHAASFAHPWSATELEALLSAANTVADGAEVAGKSGLLGFVLSRFAADEAEILTIAVDPHRRRRSIGRQLLDAHVDALIHKGVTSLFLEVGEDNTAARMLYKVRGFVEVGRREGYYRPAGGLPAAALVLRLDLR